MGNLKKEIFGRLLITLLWVAALSILRIIFGTKLLDLFLLLLGALTGTFIPAIDHFIYVYFSYPDDPVGQEVRRLFSSVRYKEAIKLLSETRSSRTRLVFHSALFQVIFWAICFFYTTSSGDLYKGALVLSMALHLLTDEWRYYLAKRFDELRSWLFWQIKREISYSEQRIFLFVMTALFVVMSFLLV